MSREFHDSFEDNWVVWESRASVPCSTRDHGRDGETFWRRIFSRSWIDERSRGHTDSQRQGELVAYAGRSIDAAEPKYKLPAGFKKSMELYNLHRVLALSAKDRETIIVCEGFFDCVKVHQAGRTDVVALMGSSLSDTQEKDLQTFSRVILYLDGDAAVVYSPIEHLAKTLWLGRFDWSNRMAMYSAFFDESGHPDDSLYVTVAGCVADVGQWVHFEREWLQLLEPFGIKIFHAVDFEQSRPPFDALSVTDRRNLLRLFLGIIRRRVEKTFCHIVTIADYHELDRKYLFSESYGFPYPAAARSCMGWVADWAIRHSIPQDHIEYIFEDGAKHKGQLAWIAERDRLPGPVFRTKQQAVPLQAGDLMGWLLNRIVTQQDHMAADLLEEFEESHSCEWTRFTFEWGEAMAKWLNIPQRDPRFRYKCRILRKDGKRVAVIHRWPKNEAQPKVDRKTLILPSLAPPFSSCTIEEIEGSELLRALAKVVPS